MSAMICEMCHGPLPEGSSAWRKYCDSCYRARRRQRDRERWGNQRKAMEEVDEPKKKPAMTITDIAREAQAHHMSYGQYVAIMRR